MTTIYSTVHVQKPDHTSSILAGREAATENSFQMFSLFIVEFLPEDHFRIQEVGGFGKTELARMEALNGKGLAVQVIIKFTVLNIMIF